MYYPKLIKDWMKYPSRIMILIYLYNKGEGNCISKMRKELKIAIIQQWKNLKYLSSKKLIYFKKKKKDHKTKYVYLTPTGKLIASKLNDLDLLLSSI